MATIWFAVNQPAFAADEKNTIAERQHNLLCKDLRDQIAFDYTASRQAGTSQKFIHRAIMLTDIYMASGCSPQELGRFLTRPPK
jgi:hypothetical protein